MSLDACAEIVQRGDPDRFAAVMAAPTAARARLFPLYAFIFFVFVPHPKKDIGCNRG